MTRALAFAACVVGLAGCASNDALIDLTITPGMSLTSDDVGRIAVLDFSFSGVEAFSATRELGQAFASTGERVVFQPHADARGAIQIVIDAEDTANAMVASGHTTVTLDGKQQHVAIVIDAATQPDFTAVALVITDETGGAMASAGNGILDPGESVTLQTTWHNNSSTPIMLQSSVTSFTGVAGSMYAVVAGSASYGMIDANASAPCTTCMQVSVSAPTMRPTFHWDTSLVESLSTGVNKLWLLHIGESYDDVLPTHVAYSAVEALVHATADEPCSANHFCPDATAPNLQPAVMIAKLIAGGAVNVPMSGTIDGVSYACISGGSSAFSDVAPTSGICPMVNYLRSKHIVSGCDGGAMFCPNTNAIRADVTDWVARALVTPNNVPTSYTDPTTGRSYDCSIATPNLHFTDVTTADEFCASAHYLWAKGVEGCSLTMFCPDSTLTRGAVATMLSAVFSIPVYHP